jgi:hypothetical protein
VKKLSFQQKNDIALTLIYIVYLGLAIAAYVYRDTVGPWFHG